MKRIVKLLAPVILGLVILVPLVSAQGTPIGEADTAAGEGVYSTYCSACHMATGTGVPSAFPPLADHFPDLVAVDGGRDYVINVVLYGLMGAIEVNGVNYNSVMTPHASMLDDQKVADVLNFVATAWDNAGNLPDGFLAFTADEVAAQRANQISSADVLAKREALDLDAD